MKTQAEYQRAYRERKKAAREAAGDPTDTIAKEPFSEWLKTHDANWSEFTYPLEWAGVTPPDFATDDDPEHDPASDGPARGSIGRAERTVGMLLDAAGALARHVNAYKRHVIKAEEDRLNEEADRSSTERRREILAELVILNRMLGQLDKQVRWMLPEWRVRKEG